MSKETKKLILGNIRYIGLGFIAFALLLFLIVFYINDVRRQIPIIFSEKGVLESTWENYKLEYIEPSTGRTLDKQQNNITTSEGQSYTMLRAVWLDDKKTFDQSLKWTQEILKHKDDNLHAWLFGEVSPGTYGILTERGGQNSATDAETDIAMSLIFAYAKWNDTRYLDQAKALINDIWENEVISVKGRLIIAANDVERFSRDKIVVNPSYFSPYAYRMFARIDPKHDWQGVIDSSYEIINESSKLPLNKEKSAGIPPDWISINRSTGAIEAITNSGLTSNYSYDAFRLPWRLALDWQWYKEPRAKETLDQFAFFSDEWKKNGYINVTYLHDGTKGTIQEAPAAYGGIIGYFLVSDKKNVKDVYDLKLKILYDPDTNSWKETLSYYDDNWAWFGIGLYEDLLPNLSTLITE